MKFYLCVVLCSVFICSVFGSASLRNSDKKVVDCSETVELNPREIDGKWIIDALCTVHDGCEHCEVTVPNEQIVYQDNDQRYEVSFCKTFKCGEEDAKICLGDSKKSVIVPIDFPERVEAKYSKALDIKALTIKANPVTALDMDAASKFYSSCSDSGKLAIEMTLTSEKTSTSSRVNGCTLEFECQAEFNSARGLKLSAGILLLAFLLTLIL